MTNKQLLTIHLYLQKFLQHHSIKTKGRVMLDGTYKSLRHAVDNCNVIVEEFKLMQCLVGESGEILYAKEPLFDKGGNELFSPDGTKAFAYLYQYSPSGKVALDKMIRDFYNQQSEEFSVKRTPWSILHKGEQEWFDLEDSDVYELCTLFFSALPDCK